MKQKTHSPGFLRSGHKTSLAALATTAMLIGQPATAVEFKFGGYVKVDALYDFDAMSRRSCVWK